MNLLGSKHRAARPLSSLVFLLALAAAGSASAGPITGVDGNIVGGQTITVEGAGFGDQGPEVVLFDDFDCPTCVSGEPIALDGAAVGAWSSTQNFPSYTDDQSHAGLSMLASNYLPTSGGCPEGSGCEESSNYSRASHTFSTPATEVFWSFWRYLPPTDTFPLESCDNINWKISWLYGTQAQPDNVINDWIVPVYNSQNHADGFEEPSVGSNAGFTEDEDGGNCGVAMYPMYLVEPAATGNWVRYSTHVKGSTECDGSFRLWEIPFIHTETAGYPCGDDHNTCEMLRKERLDIQTQEEAWHTFTLNAYARNKEAECAVATDVSVPRYDDAYIAVGPGAQARVEIASHQTWGDVEHGSELNMAICPPTAWSDGSVSCRVAQGSFADGAQVFLFVVDANGVVSDQDPDAPGAQGYAITLGSSGTGAGGGSPGTGGASGGPGAGGGSPGTGGENAGAGSPSSGTGSSNGAGDPAGSSNGAGDAAGGSSAADGGEGDDGCGCSTLPVRGRGAGVLLALVAAGLLSRRRSA